MKNNRLMLIFLFALSACNSGKNQFSNWSQYEEDGPTNKHSYLVIKNKHSNSHVGIVKSEDGLSAIGITNGSMNPETRVGIQFDENNKKIEYIKISENTKLNGKAHKKNFLIKKVNNKWLLEEVSE